MNHETLIDILKVKLTKIESIENSTVITGKHYYNDKLVGTYYIDYGDAFPNDLNEFQETYISNEYYKNPGAQQWNHYLIFVREKYDEKIKLSIEKNNIYTRKFVLTPDELKSYLLYQKSNKTIDTDIIFQWKDKLKVVDLDEVYSENPYVHAISRFLSNEVIKDTKIEPQSAEALQELIIENVSALKFENDYRKYPIKKDFELGQVNLVKGVNGSGKTSFLEGIELVITGKNNRDPQFSENYNSIKAVYNSNNILDNYTPSDNGKYRQRDKSWFSSSYITGNELYRTFNRYNFYDSDAAYNLAATATVESLSKYLSSIALGPEFNRIQNRLSGFLERLNKEYNNRNSYIKDENQRKINAQESINNIVKLENPIEYFKLFVQFSKEIKWKKQIPESFESSFAAFDIELQTLQSYINALNQILLTIKLKTKSEWKNEFTTIKNALSKGLEISKTIQENEKNINNNTLLYNNLIYKQSILEKSKKYFNNEVSFSLQNIDEISEKFSSEIQKYSRALHYYDLIDNSILFDNNETYDNFKKTKNARRDLLLLNLKEVQNQKEFITNNLNKLQSIVIEIKTYGKQFIALNKDADACPLCETKLTHIDLESKINSITEGINDNGIINDFDTKIITIQTELDELNKIVSNLELLDKSISSLLSIEIYANLKISEIFKLLGNTRNDLVLQKDEFTNLILIQKQLNEQGYNQIEFNQIKEEFENQIIDFKFIASNKEKFDMLYQDINFRVGSLLQILTPCKDLSLELENELKTLISAVAPGINYKDYEKELKYRADLLDKGINYYALIEGYIEHSENDDIIDTQQKVDTLNKVRDEIKKSISFQNEHQLANKIILEADDKIKNVQNECVRIKKALDVIYEILKNHSSSKVLGDFIDNNVKEIQEIFQNIHSPKEFSSIIFENNTLLLKKRIDNSNVPLNKISTGQRNALALSIFIALNKKLKHGPFLMLFDDPVAYTDDLNILSFFDYLRELVLNEKRQIVFATANEKLAGLFEKKFDFLGQTDFKIFKFER